MSEGTEVIFWRCLKELKQRGELVGMEGFFVSEEIVRSQTLKTQGNVPDVSAFCLFDQSNTKTH